MTETLTSDELFPLLLKHAEYLTLFGDNKNYTFKPLSITFDKDSGIFTYKADIVSNQQNKHNDKKTRKNSEFSKRAPRLSEKRQW